LKGDQVLRLDDTQKEHLEFIDTLEGEVDRVYSTLVLPLWDTETKRFSTTLYGYMMTIFARIDLLSSYWSGGATSRGQTSRMIGFMDKYLSPNHEANSVALHMWRHRLMHTSEPRYLTEVSTEVKYSWLLHWADHLPREQHYTLVDSHNARKLRIGLTYLISDLRRATEEYLLELRNDYVLQSKYERLHMELTSYRFRAFQD
jgi:hypothetical protein